MRILLFALSLVLSLPAPGSAQGASPDSGAAFAVLAAGVGRARVRVQGAWVDYWSLRLDEERRTLTGTPKSGRDTVDAIPDPISLDQVSEIQVASGTKVGSGAVIGGLVGALVGVGLGLAAQSEGGFLAPTDGQVAEVGAVLGLAGAGAGALVGSGKPRWRTIYRAADAILPSRGPVARVQ